MDSAKKCIFATIIVLFAGDEHMFAVHEHTFADGEHKFTEQEHKILKCMANFVLQELPDEMTDGKKIVYPKMQTYSLHDYETVIKHMRTYAGNISEGIIRAVFDALTSTMQSWMPLGHNIKINGLGVFSLSLGLIPPRLQKRLLPRTNRMVKTPRKNTDMYASRTSTSGQTLSC